ncbi:enoyl-CoA hydratase/isomerase family protein [Hyphobacterium sp. SN044]|uniref:enoyl-CoA hydratase/isomerase family protein n=1 Tax=Hyphobacterium sp. SN044 TaxID=2912575 RepID=UPI001F251710|nr:enoyl-CoA hydratase/isomerase family protein [Hyphobacterium sp. SN044]
MTAPSGHALVRRERRNGVSLITLDRPSRGNALVPDLLAHLHAALDQSARDGGPLVLTGSGKAFSTGGDIAGFLEHAASPGALRDYAASLVGALNRVILTLRRHPGTVIAAVNGPVTGGSLGLALAADRVLMSDAAFVQPYYALMGFAPDGGWTALLPHRIGAARASGWIASDTRQHADDLLRIGFADRVCAPEALLSAALSETQDAVPLDPAIILGTRRLTGQDAESLAPALEAERQAFLAHIVRPETLDRMRAFTAPKPEAKKCAS